MIVFLVFATLVGSTFAQGSSGNATLCTGVIPGSFIADVSACNRYFTCTSDGAEPVPGTCPSPWMFNAVTQSCDWAENVQCFQCPANPAFIDLPVSGSCTQFVRCFNGQASQHICPDSLFFDPVVGQCNLPDNVDCQIPDIVCPPNQVGGPTFHPDATDCAKYTICVNGQAVPATCPSPLVFNPITTTCDNADNVNCPTPPGTMPTPTPTDGLPTVPTGGPTSPDPTISVPPSTIPVPTPPPSTLNNFYCVSDGLFEHPSSCQMYVVCVSGTALAMNCPFGTNWDSVRQACGLRSVCYK